MDLLNALISSGNFLHSNSLVIGAGGNISARQDDAIYIKKTGVDMSSAVSSDYIKISLPPFGSKLQKWIIPENKELSSETPLHIASYLAKNDIFAVVHTHSPYAIAAAQKFSVFESPSYEFDCIVGESAPVIPYIQPGSSALADAIAEKIISGANAVIMRRHGVVTVGSDINEATLRALAVERAALILCQSI